MTSTSLPTLTLFSRLEGARQFLLKTLLSARYIKKLELRLGVQEAIIEWLQTENADYKEEKTKMGLTLVELSKDNERLDSSCKWLDSRGKTLENEIESLNKLMENGIILDIRLEDGSVIKSLKLMQVRQCYDSTWDITCNDSHMQITRRENETYRGLIEDIINCKSANDISDLDEHDQIYYD